MGKRTINPSISIIRVVAMLSIVFGHICSWKGINLDQLGGIGVEIFLFVSGYLYGKKQIPDPKRWLVARLERVLVPFWVLSLLLVAFLVISGMFERAFTQFWSTLLNLQGLNRIFYYIPEIGGTNLGGLKHCWFLTVIMLCYVFVVLIKNSKLESVIDKHPGFSLLLAGIVQLVCVYVGVQLSYVIQFFIGYFYCRVEERLSPTKGIVLAVTTILVVVVCVVRFTAHRMIDGTIFYDRVIARVSFVVIASWIFLLMDTLCHLFSGLTQSVANSKIWSKLDGLSYPIFLVHYMFMHEPFAVDVYIENVYIQIFVFLLLTFGAALILDKVNRCASRLLFGMRK